MTNTQQYLNDLNHPVGNVRLRAALSLGAHRGPDVVTALVDRLAVDDDFHVLEDLTWALAQQGEPAVPALLEMLRSEDPKRRRQAAHALSKMQRPDVAEHLDDAITDSNRDVAIKAYRAAAATESARVVDPLVSRLGDGDAEQRDALSSALRRLGELGVPQLVAALSDDDADVRLHAVETLGHVGGPAADPAVEPLLPLTGDADQELRVAAVMAIGQLSDDVAKEALEAVASSGPEDVASIARTLLTRA